MSWLTENHSNYTLSLFLTKASEITSYDSKRRIERVFNEKFSLYSS